MAKILRFPQVIDLTGLSRSSIYNRLDPNHKQFDPTFPRPFPLGPRLIGWSSDSVDIWVKRVIQQQVCVDDSE